MELENNEIPRVTQILGTSLAKVRNVQLWKVYLDFVRRFNNLTTDLSGTARRTVSEAFERVLQEVGTDKDSGEIWREYIQFLRSGPGNLGGGGWQDQQKMDLLRKAYQRATSVPTDAVIPLWKEYDAFETGLNRTTGRKLLQERSPTYITARSANIALQNVTNGLRRTTLPRLPPALGFDGDVEYMEQVHLWQKWVEWEKEDPLVLKDEDLAAYNRRILYAYRQALMALWFWPPMWYDAIEFCFRNGMKEDGEKLLDDGTDANPESCLLAFRKADHLEMTTPHADGDDDIQKRADAIKQPYDKLLDTLYGLVDKVKAREARAAGIAKENFEEQQKREAPESDDEEDAGAREEALRKAALDAQLGAIKKGHAAQIKMISRTISFSWIALMRAMRRVQGKGKMVDVTHKGSLVKKEWVGGLRGYLREARGRGRMTSDVFVASALMEYHCYKDPASKRIFDAGFKLFPEDEQFALAYMKHLINTNDVTNARAVFETAVSKLSKKPENVPRAKVLFQFLHEYECQYGELSQIVKLEQRMADLFPEDPRLTRFTQRYIFQSFDPTAVRLVTSPAAQMRPKMALPPQIHEPAQTGGYRAPTPQISSPRPLPMQLAQPGQSPSALAAAFVASNSSTNSPKRPLPADESDNDSLGIGSRKLARTDRSESPLKGAAGRRLDAQRRLGGGGGGGAGTPGIGIQRGGVEPLPNMVMFLLGILPNAEKYQGSARFNAERVVDLLRGVDLGRANTSGGKRW
ncbi:hypothetical protein P152DRAFT_176284 [Eremomyces bilateralis CBS 781.70]|uniref:mRNA 3'-end-processing protein RNA14 n=1 Tax=Eremomyces bilateralis CBS 781.70 TaxID=1392243 RepID=A0A6G1FT01_9PEZI|nr:uncharacterized protein P152DRAFT_176284 [Eremomyces bilateralis CBS 781.70]KAF1808917.1 hypothetical protein P152DRAFT_176284 [Eremomyces bilateralis CBS 781.70]